MVVDTEFSKASQWGEGMLGQNTMGMLPIGLLPPLGLPPKLSVLYICIYYLSCASQPPFAGLLGVLIWVSLL